MMLTFEPAVICCVAITDDMVDIIQISPFMRYSLQAECIEFMNNYNFSCQNVREKDLISIGKYFCIVG